MQSKIEAQLQLFSDFKIKSLSYNSTYYTLRRKLDDKRLYNQPISAADEEVFQRDLELVYSEMATSFNITKDLLKLLISNYFIIQNLCTNESQVDKWFLYKVALQQYKTLLSSLKFDGTTESESQITMLAELTEQQIKKNVETLIENGVVTHYLNLAEIKELKNGIDKNFIVENEFNLLIGAGILTIAVLTFSSLKVFDVVISSSKINDVPMSTQQAADLTKALTSYSLLLNTTSQLFNLFSDLISWQKSKYWKQYKTDNQRNEILDKLIKEFLTHIDNRQVLGTDIDASPELSTLFQQDTLSEEQVVTSLNGASNQNLARNRFILFTNKHKIHTDLGNVEQDLFKFE